MRDIMLSIILFFFTFIGRFSIFIYSRGKKKKKLSVIAVDMQYLIKKFKLDSKIMDTVLVGVLISLIDALIISIAFMCAIIVTDSLFLELLIGFAAVFILIFCFNEIFGRILIMKGYGKNEL